jgi:hypothetical protein
MSQCTPQYNNNMIVKMVNFVMYIFYNNESNFSFIKFYAFHDD